MPGIYDSFTPAGFRRVINDPIEGESRVFDKVTPSGTQRDQIGNMPAIFSVAGTTGFDVNPVGNYAPGYFRGAWLYAGTTSENNKLEFLFQINVVSDKGANATPGPGGLDTGGKVAAFIGMDQQPGSGGAYALNVVSQSNPGVGDKTMVGIEIDRNNNNQHTGDGDGVAGFLIKPAYALYITGGGTKRDAAAIGIDLAANGNGYPVNRGITFFNGTITKNTIEDICTSNISFLIEGQKTVGIDMANSVITSGVGMRLGASHLLSWLKVDGSANLPLLGKDANDIFVIGTGAPHVLLPNPGPAWASYSNAFNAVDVNVNSFPDSSMFGNNVVGIASALTGRMVVPANCVAGNASAGLSGYVLSYSSSQGAVGVQGHGLAGADGVSTWGLNSVATNSPQVQGPLGSGLSSVIVYGAEFDIRLVKKGGTVPNVPVRGIYVNGEAEYDHIGSVANAIDIPPLIGIGAHAGASVPWFNWAYAPDGAAAVFAYVGALGSGTSKRSMPIQLHSKDAGGTDRISQLDGDLNGNPVLKAAAGAGNGTDNHTNGSIYLEGTPRFFPASGTGSAAPARAGELVVDVASATQLRFRLLWSDGITRSATLTLT